MDPKPNCYLKGPLRVAVAALVSHAVMDAVVSRRHALGREQRAAAAQLHNPPAAHAIQDRSIIPITRVSLQHRSILRRTLAHLPWT